MTTRFKLRWPVVAAYLIGLAWTNLTVKLSGGGALQYLIVSVCASILVWVVYVYLDREAR